MVLQSVVLFVLCLASRSLGGAEEAVTAISLTEGNFVSEVSASPHFVMFYAPWCGHCKRLAPTWEELAGKMNQEKEVTIGKVDCTEQTALCSAQDVTGYPTLKFFKSGAEKEDGVKYRGNRDLASLEKFIKEKLGAEVADEKPAAGGDSEAKVEAGLHVLSEGSFASTVASGDTFIKFYAPWSVLSPSLKHLINRPVLPQVRSLSEARPGLGRAGQDVRG